MAKEILKDEILKDAELDQVAGGITQELKELYKAAKSNPEFVKLTHMNTSLTDIGEIEMELMETLDNFGVHGLLFQGKKGSVNTNLYYHGDNEEPVNKISHAELLNMIRNYGK